MPQRTSIGTSSTTSDPGFLVRAAALRFHKDRLYSSRLSSRYAAMYFFMLSTAPATCALLPNRSVWVRTTRKAEPGTTDKSASSQLSTVSTRQPASLSNLWRSMTNKYNAHLV
ncbi:unnamed protein product [Ectocarpus fasciculatus]